MFFTEKATLALRRWDSTGRRLFFHLRCRVCISVMEIVERYVKQLGNVVLKEDRNSLCLILGVDFVFQVHFVSLVKEPVPCSGWSGIGMPNVPRLSKYT
jgi:hypothetical protein